MGALTPATPSRPRGGVVAGCRLRDRAAIAQARSGDGRASYDEVPGTGSARVCLAAPIREAPHGRSQPGSFPGAHVAVEDVLAGEDVAVGGRAAVTPHRLGPRPFA